MIPPPLVETVLAQAVVAASHNWEYSTVFEALLEYHDPECCIFNTPPLSDQIPTLDFGNVKALRYVRAHIRTDSETLCEGNGSAADLASLGIPTLFLSKSLSPIYFSAGSRQLNTLLDHTPRFPNGAISHREATASLWADFIYMVPPFFAYYGVVTDDLALLKASERQCELYRDILGTKIGVWKHIVNTEGTAPDVKADPGLWSTGNAWAAAGMARVLATMRKSKFVNETVEEQDALVRMIGDIIDGVVSLDTDHSGLLRNYLDDEGWFAEVAGTALLAATVFRMAVLEPRVFGKNHTDWALRKMEVVS